MGRPTKSQNGAGLESDLEPGSVADDREMSGKMSAVRAPGALGEPDPAAGNRAVGRGVRPVVEIPEASLLDGPIELEAKADVIADQAELLLREAKRLDAAAGRAASRRRLRQRARRLDRNPFASLQAPNRRVFRSTGRQTDVTTGTGRPAAVGNTAAGRVVSGDGNGPRSSAPVSGASRGRRSEPAASGQRSAHVKRYRNLWSDFR